MLWRVGNIGSVVSKVDYSIAVTGLVGVVRGERFDEGSCSF